MIIYFSRNNKKGNVILVVICVIVALLILLASFFKSTTSRIFTTKKLSNVMIAREFASSLAILSTHYIKNHELKDKGSSLIKELSLPYDKMSDEKKEDITEKLKNFVKEKVNNNSEDVLTLLEKESGLNELSWNLSWSILKDDFKPINVGNSEKAPYPREKTGLVKLNINITHVLPGTKTPTTEDYIFSSTVSVTANIFPVLSKFTLYIEDVFDGEEPNNKNGYRFNVIDTLASGDLKNGATIRPWVLNNGETSKDARSTYDDLVNDPRGFVYLGGGNKEHPIILGIARGWSDEGFGKYGEDFHFFKNENKKAGYWKTFEIFNSSTRQGIMMSNIGLCNDISDDNLQSWQEQLAGSRYEEASKYHSIFKLFGTDSQKSPTMVLGFVDSVCDSIRMFKDSDGKVNFLSYLETQKQFESMSGLSVDGVPPFNFGTGSRIVEFVNAFLDKFGFPLELDGYNDTFASRLLQNRYNEDYTYILTNNKIDYPISRGNINDDKLKKLCDASNTILINEVPSNGNARYSDIFGSDLTKLSVFLDKEKLFIDGTTPDPNDIEPKRNLRLMDSFHVKEIDSQKAYSKTINDYLTNNGYLNNGSLDLNGFIYFDVDENISYDFEVDKLKVMRNSGIIFSKGDIRIKGDIDSDPNSHFSLVTLNGNITIERGVKNINASLITKEGQVKLEGNANDSELNVTGNVVMKKIQKGNIKTDDSICIKRGMNLNYKEDLSAIPYNSLPEDDRTEASLLMFGLKDDLKMLD